ncbi:MAG: dual specificity protein phosphatase family protein, partial [Aggregatilineales bacterium]
KDHTIVVACGAGISRSTTIIMAALMEYEDRDLFDAYAQVYEHHPIANPHYKLVMSLADYHGIELDLSQTLDGLRAVQRED